MSLIQLAKNFRKQTVKSIEEKLHFIYPIIYEEYDWDNDDDNKLVQENNGFSVGCEMRLSSIDY